MVKDLGPQVSWRTVFVTEYVRFFFFSSLVCRLTSLYIYIYKAGPLIIHPILYHLPKVFYRGSVQHSQLQKCVHHLIGKAYGD